MQKYKVEVYEWHLKGLSELVRKFIKKASDVTDGFIPEKFTHVGVAVHKSVYDFNISGIKSHSEIPIEGRSVVISNATTTKTPQEVMDFISTRFQREKYSIATYDPFSNNCIDFAEDFCNFLGVKLTGSPVSLNLFLKSEKARILLPIPKNKFFRDRIFVFFGCLRPKEKQRRTFVDGSRNNGSQIKCRTPDVEDSFQVDDDSEESDEEDFDDADFDFSNMKLVTINF